jgi:hypothetical protein
MQKPSDARLFVWCVLAGMAVACAILVTLEVNGF